MKIACLSFTESGRILGEKIKGLRGGPYSISHYINGEIEGGIRAIIDYLWRDYQGLVFIASTGIAIRMIGPHIEDKTLDPAVVVIDDLGRYAISLLSGHLGGANKLSRWLGEKTGSLPIVTTASDGRNIESIDLFAKKNNYHMEDMRNVTRITAMMVNGKTIGFVSEEDQIIDYPKLIKSKKHQSIGELEASINKLSTKVHGLIIVSSYDLANIGLPHVYLRPRNINIGIGCRRGVEGKRIIEAIERALGEAGLSPKAIKSMATVDVKKDEEGIREGAKHFNCPLEIFSLSEIREVEDRFPKSQFVKDAIGVYSVSEPAAYLLGGHMIKNKLKYNGITISISKER